MPDVVLVLLRSLLSGCQSRRLLLLENLALRHQLTVLRRQTCQLKLRPADRLLWLALRQLWPDWHRALLLVQPRTLIAWHRLGFRLFWRFKSRARGGRPAVDHKLIQLTRRMWSSNPIWGSKRIQAELSKLGIEVSDSTIRKYRPRTRRGDQTWKTFLHNHAKDLIAVDFFVVPTATFRLLYVFLVLAHERRKILHFNITDSPAAAWTAQLLTEAFPYANPPRYLLRDRDSIYGLEFVQRTLALGELTPSPLRSPSGRLRRNFLHTFRFGAGSALSDALLQPLSQATRHSRFCLVCSAPPSVPSPLSRARTKVKRAIEFSLSTGHSHGVPTSSAFAVDIAGRAWLISRRKVELHTHIELTQTPTL
jgi:hypothetical protein